MQIPIITSFSVSFSPLLQILCSTAVNSIWSSPSQFHLSPFTTQPLGYLQYDFSSSSQAVALCSDPFLETSNRVYSTLNVSSSWVPFRQKKQVLAYRVERRFFWESSLCASHLQQQLFQIFDKEHNFTPPPSSLTSILLRRKVMFPRLFSFSSCTYISLADQSIRTTYFIGFSLP